MPGIDVSDQVKTMLGETLDAAGSHGVGGFVDDLMSLVRDWDFRVEDVVAPTRIMLARDDTSVPAAHGSGWSDTSRTPSWSGWTETTSGRVPDPRWS
jgi:hypothetical protein